MLTFSYFLNEMSFKSIVLRGKDFNEILDQLGVEGIRITKDQMSDLRTQKRISVEYRGQNIDIGATRKSDGSFEIILPDLEEE